MVEPGVLTRLGVDIGEQIRIGEATFTVRATIVREPDRLGGFVGIGPRVMIAMADLARTQVIVPGALARYDYRFALPAGTDAAALVAELRRSHPDAHWRARGTRDVQPQVTRFTDRLASYLTMAALTTLLIGGVGVALAIQNYLAGKTATIATLKCLGARSRLIFRMYLLQVLVLAGIGIAARAGDRPARALAAGGGRRPAAADPVEHRLLSAAAADRGRLRAADRAGVRHLAARARRARCRRPACSARCWCRRERLPPAAALIGLGLSLAALAALAVAGVADRRLGAIFVARGGGARPSCWSASPGSSCARSGWSGSGAARACASRSPTCSVRAPARAGVIVALGAGLTVLTMVALLERNLAAEIELRLPERAPGVFFIDIQRDQVDRFEQAVAAIDGCARPADQRR